MGPLFSATSPGAFACILLSGTVGNKHLVRDCLSVVPQLRFGQVVCLLQPVPCSRPLRVTPAMQAGITDHVWSLGDLITA